MQKSKAYLGSECAEIPHSLSLCMYTFYPECLDIDALDTHCRPRWGPTGREQRRFQGNIPSTAAAGWPCVKTLSTSCMCSQKPFAVWGLIIFWVKPLNWKGYGGPLPPTLTPSSHPGKPSNARLLISTRCLTRTPRLPKAACAIWLLLQGTAWTRESTCATSGKAFGFSNLTHPTNIYQGMFSVLGT